MNGFHKLVFVGIVCLTLSQEANAQLRLRHRHQHSTYVSSSTSQKFSLNYNTCNGLTQVNSNYTESSIQQIQITGNEGDGLAEVNARRARSGLPPYLPDPLLTQAARSCAAYRAARRLFGHVTGGMGDFQFLPQGAYARFGGCAAYEDAMGWMSCGVEDRTARYAGAYWVRGSDGKRYMHLFAR